MRRLLLEGLMVVTAGLMVGWAANELSPQGIDLGRDYFGYHSSSTRTMRDGRSMNPPPPPQPDPSLTIADDAQASASPGANATVGGSGRPASTPGTGGSQAGDPIHKRLRAKGLKIADHEQTAAWFHDGRYLVGEILFIDARDDAHYLEGHIPNALQFDHYRPEAYAPDVLNAGILAQYVVVYCNGGECEDSEFAAIHLAEMGIDSEKIYVYPGGIQAWKEAGLPIETGPRGSGILVE